MNLEPDILAFLGDIKHTFPIRYVMKSFLEQIVHWISNYFWAEQV